MSISKTQNDSCYKMIVNWHDPYNNATLSTYEIKTSLSNDFLLACFFLSLIIYFNKQRDVNDQV